MIAMLSPDLLDRRALAAIQLVDIFGAPMQSPARIHGDGARIFAKGVGQFVVLGAVGLDAHTTAFSAPPGAPAIGSQRVTLDIAPDDRSFAPRRARIRLPRDPDSAQPNSLFAPIAITMLPGPDATIPATAAAVRVTVTQQSDGRRVGGALVRVASDNGLFTGHAVTDIAGEALVLVPQFPMTHVGNNASVTDGLPARVTVVADPATAVLTADAGLIGARFATAPDPDTLTDDFPPPAGGTAVRLSVRKPARVAITWSAP